MTAVDSSTSTCALSAMTAPAFYAPLAVGKRERSEKRFIFFLALSIQYELGPHRIVLFRSRWCEWKKCNERGYRQEGSILCINWWDNWSCRKIYLPLTSVRVFAPSKLATIERS